MNTNSLLSVTLLDDSNYLSIRLVSIGIFPYSNFKLHMHKSKEREYVDDNIFILPVCWVLTTLDSNTSVIYD